MSTLYKSLLQTLKSSQFAFTSRFLVMDVSSVDYTSLTVTAAHIKSFLHNQTFSITALSQFLPIPLFPSPHPGRLPSRNSTDLNVKVNVTLRLAVYRQLVRLGVKHLETHDLRAFTFS
jgi:hypothetical protein